MKYGSTCGECGHIKTAYTLPLNKSKVAAFIKFADRYLREGKPIAKGELGLTNSQYGNFQNLRHFGIIEQREKGSEWYLTPLGEAFFFGEASVNVPAAHMAGETLPPDHPAWATHEDKPVAMMIGDIEATHYKRRPEYQAEKAGHLL
jgi:hypothetical protein